MKSRNLEKRGATTVAAPPAVQRALRPGDQPGDRSARKSGRRPRLLSTRRLEAIVITLTVFLAAQVFWTSLDLYWFPSRAPKAVIRVTSTKDEGARLDAMVEEILERPLFTADRTPPPEPPSPEALAALQPPVLKSHLAGITIIGDDRRARFVSEAKESLSLKEGDEIDGFKVQSITADEVILTSRFGPQTVKPSKGLAAIQTVRNTKPVEMGNFDPDKPGGSTP